MFTTSSNFVSFGKESFRSSSNSQNRHQVKSSEPTTSKKPSENYTMNKATINTTTGTDSTSNTSVATGGAVAANEDIPTKPTASVAVPIASSKPTTTNSTTTDAVALAGDSVPASLNVAAETNGIPVAAVNPRAASESTKKRQQENKKQLSEMMMKKQRYRRHCNHRETKPSWIRVKTRLKMFETTKSTHPNKDFGNKHEPWLSLVTQQGQMQLRRFPTDFPYVEPVALVESEEEWILRINNKHSTRYTADNVPWTREYRMFEEEKLERVRRGKSIVDFRFIKGMYYIDLDDPTGDMGTNRNWWDCYLDKFEMKETEGEDVTSVAKRVEENLDRLTNQVPEPTEEPQAPKAEQASLPDSLDESEDEVECLGVARASQTNGVAGRTRGRRRAEYRAELRREVKVVNPPRIEEPEYIELSDSD